MGAAAPLQPPAGKIRLISVTCGDLLKQVYLAACSQFSIALNAAALN